MGCLPGGGGDSATGEGGGGLGGGSGGGEGDGTGVEGGAGGGEGGEGEGEGGGGEGGGDDEGGGGGGQDAASFPQVSHEPARSPAELATSIILNSEAEKIWPQPDDIMAATELQGPCKTLSSW